MSTDVDERFSFISDNITSILRISKLSDQYHKLQSILNNSNEIVTFLDDSKSLVLHFVCTIEGEYKFYTTIQTIFNSTSSMESNNDLPQVVFIRHSLDPISSKNIECLVDVHSIQPDSFLKSLQSIIKNIYVPLINSNNQSTGKVPTKVQQLLCDLDANLSIANHDSDSTSSWIQNIDTVAINIEELSDEIARWRVIKNDRRSPYYQLAHSIDIEFTKLESSGLLDLPSVQLNDDMNYLMTLIFDILHNIWCICDDDGKCYPQIRMESLLACVGATLVRYSQTQLSKLDIWSAVHDDEQRTTVFLELQSVSQFIDSWNFEVSKIILCWSRGNVDSDERSRKDVWKGDLFNDSYAKGFHGRLEETINILKTQSELSQLLTIEECRLYRVDKLLIPLSNLNPIIFNPFSQSTWLKAIGNYELSLEPLEKAVAIKIRSNLTKYRNHTQDSKQSHQSLAEFQKYKSLLRRPMIYKSLITEREELFVFVKDCLQKIESIVDDIEVSVESGIYNGNSINNGDDTGSDTLHLLQHRSNHLTATVDRVVYLKQLHAKVLNIRNTCLGLFNDFDGFEKFHSQCDQLLHTIASREKRIFESWLHNVQQRIIDDDPLLLLQGSLLSWKDGILVVSYSDELLIFKQEVRQFQDLGFKIPSNKSNKDKSILARVAEAEKYYKYGMSLQKTANFYNSLSDQIIGVQEELLLESLTAFASLVSKHSGINSKSNSLSKSMTKGAVGTKAIKNEISWGDHTECEEYVRTLNEAAEKLATENRILRQIHESLCEHVVALTSIDFLTQTDMWKQRWRQIKDTVSRIKSKYPTKDCRQWILHWDHQVYKALEASYQMGLESLHESLPNIRVDLIFAHKKIDFKPSLEQLKLSFHSEIKKFISMPTTFDGFGNSDVYKKMVPNNASRLGQVYTKAEILFAKIAEISTRYESWVTIGSVNDLDTFVEANVLQIDEYVANFRSIRSKLKALDKLPDQEKIDCCTVSLLPFKSSVEDLYRRLNDTLLITLRRSLLEQFREVDMYLDTSTLHLSTRPQTVSEFGQAKRELSDIETQKDLVKSQSKLCVEKKKLLLKQAPGSGVDVTEVINRMANIEGECSRWDKFDSALASFEDLINEQKEVLKDSLDEEISALNLTIEKVSSRWRQLKPTEAKSWDHMEVQRIFVDLQDWSRQFDELQQQLDTLTESCDLFGMPKPRVSGLEILQQDLASTRIVWDLLKVYNEELKLMADQNWLTFSVNIYALLDFAQRWQEKIKVMTMTANESSITQTSTEKGTSTEVMMYISDSIERIKKSIPALKYCQGEPFKEDHWTELLQGKLQLPREIRRENVRVEHFLSRLHILVEPSMLSFAKNLQSRALGEVQIREALLEIRSWERTAEVKLLTPEESGRKIPLIKDWKDLILELGDKQALLGSLKDSEYFKAFADQGLALEAKMTVLDTTVHTLNTIQRKWVYLEPIFTRGALPAEESRFRRVDKEFSDIMLTLSQDPKLFTLVDEQLLPKLPSRLKEMTDQLDRCQKALTDFLEAKRSSMPRFYFIGDDDLLEILGQAKNPTVVQSHLKKLFQGIHKVVFNKDNSKIVAIVSSSDEVVELDNPVTVNEKVEVWFESLVSEMRSTLSSMLKRSLSKKSLDWSFPSQIINLTHVIQFTEDAEHAIVAGPKELDHLHSKLQALLHDLTSDDLSAKPLLQLKVKSLVFDIVHNIDIVTQLQASKVSSIQDWKWKKQLRYYIENGKTIVKMHDATFIYTYEYQGNIPRLVHTPLTDKCFLTLTQGMHMGFGSSLIGPAGTGKTESVKALASCLGRQVLVFNCDEALDSTSMIRIFTGIVKCGAWSCFDEFNRLKEDQLSAISQQIQIIQDAIKMKTPTIQLLGVNVDVDFNSGIFVTLNPAGKNYGGRSRLPDNLKALFRPIAMSVPDNELIADVSLVSEGFSESKELASKVVSLFKLAKQLLSSQRHYDFGLRGLKAVLNSAGRLIQQHKQSGEIVSKKLEFELLIKAVRVNTLSKLTYVDTRKFLPLIGDVFPGVQSADIAGGELETAIHDVMSEKPFRLVVNDAQIKKMIQLKESLDQRIGCVIVGPPCSGKTSLWQVLKAAMIKCGQPVISYIMNPKSMPRQQLLGRMDTDTQEWFDGVLTDAARKVVKEGAGTKCWIICDGDIDPEWIESLNSVLDDNHLLTLPNGERISFGSNINFIFETHDLKYASPATVSRMGMIFLSNEDLQCDWLLQRFLNSIVSDERREVLSDWIEELFLKSLNILSSYELVIECGKSSLVFNGLAQVSHSCNRQDFICGLIRGLGGNLNIVNRSAFAKEVYRLARERPVDSGAPLDCYVKDGSSKVFTDTQFSSNDVNDITLSSLGTSFVIPTISVERAIHTLNPLIASFDPILLVGPEGCGKAMILQHAFADKRNSHIITIHCNAQTSATDVISKLSQSCLLTSLSDGRAYRPRDSERLVLYFKNINLPRPDKYETCQLVAFLQQLITLGGFYSSELEFMRVERVQVVVSMSSGNSIDRHTVSCRLTSLLRIVNVDYPDTSELVSIYDSYLSVIFNTKVGIKDKQYLQSSDKEKLANAIIEIYQKVKESCATEQNSRHYSFTLRSLTEIVKGLSRYDLQSESLLEVLSYECSRVFRDRMVRSEACAKFDKIVATVLQSHFKFSSQIKLSSVYFSSLGSERNISGSIDTQGEECSGRPLVRMSEEDLSKSVSDGTILYEREEKDLKLLLHSEILQHISHIDRAISAEGGHCLLVGRSGVGRCDAVTIVSYMLGYELHTPAICRGYSTKQFSIDIKAALNTAGIKGEPVLFLIEDYQITTESILEMINSLLSAGEVPGLYSHEELEPLLSPLRDQMREVGGFNTPYDFFVSRLKRHLHIALCMDPGHSNFMSRCDSNPALYSHCNIIWMADWRETTLRSIPSLMSGVAQLLPDKAASIDSDNDYNQDSKYSESKHDISEKSTHMSRSKLIDMMVSIHQSCVVNQNATPRDYLSFVRLWQSNLTIKQGQLLQEICHLEAGLSKLNAAADVVRDLSESTEKQEKELRIAQTAADKAMDDISCALTGASDRRVEVAEVKKTVAENEKSAKLRKREIEAELSEIQPLLDQAKLAVGSIKSEHLSEIRSLAAPPEPIADVLAAVLMMLGVQDISWQSMKKFLGNRGVKEEILKYDASKMSDVTRNNVIKLMKKKPNSFEDAVIARASAAAAPMCTWAKANIKYSQVVEKIQPLQAELDDATQKLRESEHRLVVCEEELCDIDVRVGQLKTEFASRTGEAERLKANLETATVTLDKAQRLIGQLKGEQVRWRVQVTTLKQDMTILPVKMLLVAGFICYLSKSPEDVRMRLMSQWQQTTGITTFDFTQSVSSENELLAWKSMGLPDDNLSQENGISITSSFSDRFCLVIDPASTATEWLKALLSTNRESPLEVVNQHDPRFVNQVELAVRFGKTLLVLDANGVEPFLYLLCRRDVRSQGSRLCVTIGDKVVDYNEKFRMVLCTRNPHPNLSADAASLVQVVNFTITRSGLEGQLLSLAIQHERPELEKEKSTMLKKEEDFKIQLASMERKLLQSLATADGDLLANTTLIESLTKTKEASAEISEALRVSAQVSIELDNQRNVYRSFAEAGSKLFFLVKELTTMNNMYQFSLPSFVHLFITSLQKDHKVSDVKEKLEALQSDLETETLHFIGRALFKSDRFTFALHLVHRMHPELFQDREWEIFTGSLVSSSIESNIPRGFPSWAATDRASAFRLLQEQLPSLITALELDNSKWHRFATSHEAEKDIPLIRGMSPFQRILIIQALRPDRLHSVMIQFCQDQLRVQSILPPALSLHTLYKKSTTSILLLSSPGSDPSQELLEYANSTVGHASYKELAMGGGQLDTAIQLIRHAAETGSWVALKNLHLVVAWLSVLEKELASLKPHKNFRLWLTSESHHNFPSILLEESLKATYESPPGIKKNMQRTFDSWDRVKFSQGSTLQKRLLFLLACFHAIIQERRTYVPQGWSKPYEFSTGDIRAGVFAIEAAVATMKKGSSIDWNAIHGLMEDAIYGGRIDSAHDMRILRAYLKLFFNDNLVNDKSGGIEILPGTPLRMPSIPEYEYFQKIISQLPDIDSPYMFGLPESIDRSLQRISSSAVLVQLRSLLVVGEVGEGFNRERVRVRFGPILDLWEQLIGSSGITKSCSDVRKIVESTTVSEGSSPVDELVVMENSMAAGLCTSVNTMLTDLKKALLGSGQMTFSMQQIAMKLLSGSIPVEWSRDWINAPESVQAWLKELVRKRIGLTRLCSLVEKKKLLSEPINLNDFFSPCTFISALRQLTARSTGCPMDQLKLICRWEKDTLSLRKCSHTCIITGLWLQGADIHPSTGCLTEPKQGAADLVLVHTVTIGFVPITTSTVIDSSSELTSVPVFLSPSREESLMELSMKIEPSSKNDMKLGQISADTQWVLAGTALFLRSEE